MRVRRIDNSAGKNVNAMIFFERRPRPPHPRQGAGIFTVLSFRYVCMH